MLGLIEGEERLSRKRHFCKFKHKSLRERVKDKNRALKNYQS